MKIEIRNNIEPREWSHCLGLLRESRYLILRNSEGFHEAATVLEEIGRVISGACGTGLGCYRNALLAIAGIGQKSESGKIFRNFEVVKNARNGAVHNGAWARHLSDRLIDLLLIIESAIKDEIAMKRNWLVEDIMVRNPTIAEKLHRIDHVRREMLANSYSCLPILDGDKWYVITDAAVMRFLWCASIKPNNEAKKAMTINDAIKTSEIKLVEAYTCLKSESAIEVAKKFFKDPKGRESLPIVVLQDCKCGEKSTIVGILTAFDIL